MAIKYHIVLYAGLAIALFMLVFVFVKYKKTKKYAGGKKIAGLICQEDEAYFRKRKILYKTGLTATLICCVLVVVSAFLLMAKPYTSRRMQDEKYCRDIILCIDISTSVDYLNENLLDKLTANLPVEINISSKEHLMEFLTNMYGSVEDFYDKVLKPIIGKWDAGHFAWNAVGDVFVYIKNFVLGFFIAFYILASKEKRIGQVNKFRKAMFKPETDSKITSFVALVDKSFGGFIYGKLIDSLIIGILTFGLMTVLDVSPYNMLIATFVGVTNIIPVFGPFIGAIPSFFIVLISNPSKALLFIILIIVIQQLDGNVIGPKILGDNTGVSSLTVIIAITLCGSLWGVVGMLIGVPLFAVIIEMVRRWLEARLAAKGEPTDTLYYYPKNALSNAERDLYYEHAGIRYRYEHSKLKTRVDKLLARFSGKSKTPPAGADTEDTKKDNRGNTEENGQDS